MLGYFKRPELTAAVFDEEGNNKTGEIMAEIAPDCLTFVGRRNDGRKLAQGEFVAVSKLEGLYASENPLIQQIYIFGSSERAYLLGVVVPNMEQLGAIKDESSIKATLYEGINEIARARGLAAYEVPRDLLIEYEPFSIENGLLTGLGKFARPALKTRYGTRLMQLYTDIEAKRVNDVKELRLN